jgi:hypothetical protein
LAWGVTHDEYSSSGSGNFGYDIIVKKMLRTSASYRRRPRVPDWAEADSSADGGQASAIGEGWHASSSVTGV